jgi:hypothetical protein
MNTRNNVRKGLKTFVLAAVASGIALSSAAYAAERSRDDKHPEARQSIESIYKAPFFK